jgi:putative membrane protein
MKRTAIVLSCLLLATPVVAQSLGEKTGVNSTLGISPTTQDFATQVAISDMFEIASSKLAQSQGNAAEKKFAEQMITDHAKTSSELKRLVTGGTIKVELPSQLDSAHQSKLDKLNQAKGDEFSSTYASQQVSAHKDAVSLFERYAKGGDQAELKDWAAKTLPALKHHLEMAQQLDQQRSAPTVGSTNPKK